MNDIDPEERTIKHTDKLSETESLSRIWSMLDDFKNAIERRRIGEYLSTDLPRDEITEIPTIEHFRLIRITGIKYRKRENIAKALEEFYRILHVFGTPFIYFLSVIDDQTDLCLGLHVNNKKDHEKLLKVFKALQYSLRGILPGCVFEQMHGEEKATYIKNIIGLPEKHIIKGVPSVSQSKDTNDSPPIDATAGVERLLDAMNGQEFAVAVVATPLLDNELSDFQVRIEQLHDQANLLKKASLQYSSSYQNTQGWSNSFTDGTQKSEMTGTQESAGVPHQKGNLGDRVKQNLKAFASGGDKALKQNTTGTSTQQQSGSSHQKTYGDNVTDGKTETGSITNERTSKTAENIVRQLDEMSQRTQNSRGIGMWKVGTTILSRDLSTCEKASRIYAGMISGEKSHIDPVRSYKVQNSVNLFSVANDSYEQNHLLGAGYTGLYTYMTSSELAVTAGLPFYEVPYLPVEEITDYGRSQGKSIFKSQTKKIKLGCIVDRSVETSNPVYITTEQLNRHCFVTGATGSGKSNTMRYLLLQAWEELKIPFLVIEPVKSEYRHLQNKIPDLQVFTLGHQTGSTLALNPFDFEQEVGLISHIDHLKAAFNASLGMYSSMPYILEDIIYRVYEAFGWDLGSGKNELLEQSAKQLGVPVSGPIRDLFLPQLSDLIPLVQEAIEGFFPSMTDYGGSLLGALRARLTSLTKGTKGQLLDTRNSVSMDWLLKKPCVLEIWPFADNEEKSFVMALILIKLYEYRESQHLSGKRPDGLEHLLVIEEAHRLLSKPEGQGEHGSNSKAKGVEVFADILSEIRSYGQGIMIVDQIPSKLISDVLKNTDVKIVHRLVAKDDREIVGTTMTLEELQIRDLARHEPGQATTYFEGLHAPLKIKVPECKLDEIENTNNNVDLSLIRKLECFGIKKSDSMTTFLSDSHQILAYQLVHGVLSTALSIGSDGVKNLRTNIEHQARIEPAGSEWTFIVAGLHILHEYLIRYELDPGKRVLSPAQAGYLISLSASFLRKWISGNDYAEELAILRAESLGLGVISIVSEESIPVDFLSILIGLHINEPSGRFHKEITLAIQADKESSELDWTNLYKELSKYSKALVLSSPYSTNVFSELGARLLTQYRTNDQEYKSLAGLALGTLVKAVAKYNSETEKE